MLEQVGLEGKADAYADDMSGGQQQRLAIALALVHDPDVVFLDEPTTGLDPQARRNLWDVIRAINAEAGKTVVLTTHYLEEAETLCDRVAIMDESARDRARHARRADRLAGRRRAHLLHRGRRGAGGLRTRRPGRRAGDAARLRDSAASRSKACRCAGPAWRTCS